MKQNCFQVKYFSCFLIFLSCFSMAFRGFYAEKSAFNCEELTKNWKIYADKERYRNEWITDTLIGKMSEVIVFYCNDYEISLPQIYSSVGGCYAFAKMKVDSGAILFGINRQLKEIKIEKTLEAAFEVYNQELSLNDVVTAERSALPLSSEVKASIKLPNGALLSGWGFETSSGTLFVSDDLVETEEGEVGRLVKYRTGADGEQYIIIK